MAKSRVEKGPRTREKFKEAEKKIPFQANSKVRSLPIAWNTESPENLVHCHFKDIVPWRTSYVHLERFNACLKII